MLKFRFCSQGLFQVDAPARNLRVGTCVSHSSWYLQQTSNKKGAR
jgi:hypothetical protein